MYNTEIVLYVFSLFVFVELSSVHWIRIYILNDSVCLFIAVYFTMHCVFTPSFEIERNKPLK